jgi:hypothetical protein
VSGPTLLPGLQAALALMETLEARGWCFALKRQQPYAGRPVAWQAKVWQPDDLGGGRKIWHDQPEVALQDAYASAVARRGRRRRTLKRTAAALPEVP